MAYVKNLTEHDLEVPSLGVTIPAGKAVEVEVGDDFDGGTALKVTKSPPRSAEVVESVTTPEES